MADRPRPTQAEVLDRWATADPVPVPRVAFETAIRCMGMIDAVRLACGAFDCQLPEGRLLVRVIRDGYQVLPDAVRRDLAQKRLASMRKDPIT